MSVPGGRTGIRILLIALAATLCALACSLYAGSARAATPVVISATEGKQFEGQVGEDAGLQCEKASEPETTITWGDGHQSSGVVTFHAPRALTVKGSHTYQAAGTYDGTVKVIYSCQGDEAKYEGTFVAHVAAAEVKPPVTTTTSPPPAPPPAPAVVKAAFSVASLSPGRAVLDASASVPAGASAARFSWIVTGAGQAEVNCTGSQPKLAVMDRAALSTQVLLSVTDSSGLITRTQQTLAIPGPLARAARASASAATRGFAASVTPAFTVLGECMGGSHQQLAPLSEAGSLTAGRNLISVGGAPPAECNQDVLFGAADVRGCLESITEPSALPGGITTALAQLLCGVNDHSFCVPAVTAAAGSAANFVGEELGISSSARPAARDASVGLQQAERAVPGALKSMGFPSYYSWTAVRIDGLDIDPREHQPILVIPSASVVVSADATIYLHGIQISPLHTVALYLPAAGGSLAELSLPHRVPIIGSLPFSGSVSVALRRAGTTLPNGDTCQFDCAAISVFAELPGVFSNEGHGLSAGGVITADDQQGLQLDSLEVKIPHASIAGIGVDNVDFRYRHGDDSLRGQATLDLLSGGQITAAFAFVHGDFEEGRVAWDAGDGPGIDLGGPIPVFLTRLGGGIALEPTVLTAEGAVAGGGHALGCSLFGVHGGFTIQFAPFELNAIGTGELLCQEVASEFFHVDEAGDIGVGGNVHLEIYVLSFTAGVDFEISQGHIQFDGNVQACIKVLGEHCLGAEVVISDHGIGACADLGFTHAGAGIVFPDSFEFMLDSCDIAQFRSLPMPANLSSIHRGRAHAAQALPTFDVPRGEKVAAIGVVGAGGAPNVTLRGPDGRKISTPADGYVKNSTEVVIADGAKTMETYFFINRPAPGTWQIIDNPGSVPVTAVQQSAALASPDLRGRVSRAAHGRERLSYSLRAIPGQQVTFVDSQKGHGFRVLGRAQGTHGTISFLPSSTLGRRREIVAWVSQEGHPREDVTIARYTAPAPAPLLAPRGLSAARHGNTIAVRWRAVTGAAGYSLAVRLGDGAQQYYVLPAPTHGATVRATFSVPPYLAAHLSVGARAVPGHRAGRRAALTMRAGPRPAGTTISPFSS